mmetsp:Transcript_18784/g.43493  ORF Transcript_18784/g.43493 Transcript_18784/m.43493 type:complete len:210 (-) Transcript_18784:547-1176(-)
MDGFDLDLVPAEDDGRVAATLALFFPFFFGRSLHRQEDVPKLLELRRRVVAAEVMKHLPKGRNENAALRAPGLSDRFDAGKQPAYRSRVGAREVRRGEDELRSFGGRQATQQLHRSFRNGVVEIGRTAQNGVDFVDRYDLDVFQQQRVVVVIFVVVVASETVVVEHLFRGFEKHAVRNSGRWHQLRSDSGVLRQKLGGRSDHDRYRLAR